MKLLDWKVIGLSTGAFLSITFVLCVTFDLIFTGHAMYGAWYSLLPGFKWLTWGSFFLGLGESFLYGIYIGLVFAPLYNLFSMRLGRQ
ncbi:MAG TPA: DUF5676 family membrane protein [Thermodesulfobacteriota bacterium]|nr:DUF5676 family membrane protein [Thermodesulfobacteriota bacterium]